MPLTGEYAPSTADWARKQAETYESSNGARASAMQGVPIIVLTTLGARTGKLRKTALMRVEHDGVYAVVGSLGGAPKHPLWVHNIRANPHVELQDGAERHDYVAREAEGEERDEWLRRAIDTFPPYAGYVRRTTRVLPIFLLTRRDPD
jgi:F420H(2)-dependent quinone reductase